MNDGRLAAHGRVRGTKPMEGAFAIRPDGGERDDAHADMCRVRTITCRSFRLEGQRRAVLLQRLLCGSRRGRIASTCPERERRCPRDPPNEGRFLAKANGLPASPQ